MEKKRTERDVLNSCLKLLKARGIAHTRRNVGGIKRGNRYIRYGICGEADIEAWCWCCGTHPSTVWIECKRPGGKQSRDQRIFAEMVCQLGHSYLVVESAAEVEWWLEQNLA